MLAGEGAHGVALTTLPGTVFVMCECGWHASFPTVITFDHVAALVKEHRGTEMAGEGSG